MSLQSEFGSGFSNHEIEVYGKRMLEKYGLLACEEAKKLESTNLSKGSLSSYQPQIRDIISRVSEENPEIDAVLEVIEKCDKNGSTKSLMVSAMKKYYETIGETEKAERFKVEAKKSDIESGAFSGGMEIDEWLTVEEVEKIDKTMMPEDGNRQYIMEDIGGSWIFSLEHKAMFETLYYTGCRVGELPFLQVEDFDFESNNVKVYRLKKAGEEPKRDMIAIPDEYVATMVSYLDEYDIKRGSVFKYGKRTIQNRIAEIDKAYRHTYGSFKHADSLTPHKLRHARVTAIANNSGIDKAGEFVNHSSLDTTKAYRHLAVEEQRDILPEESGGGDSDKDAIIEALLSQIDDTGDDMVETIAQSTGKTKQEAEELVEGVTE